ncbi:MAG: hypothetical protein PHE03_01805, partial [Bacteroidales bacterium]|nr:hypothetical protein [Bacteroidales bacterium]
MKRIYTLLTALSILGFTANSAFATLTVTINNKTQTQINMSEPVAVCSGADAYFFWGVTNNPPTNPYTVDSPAWSGTAATFINDINTQFITFNCSTPGTYYLTFSATKTGYGTYTVTQPIVVYSNDDLYLDFPTSSPHNSCEGSTVSLEASGTVFYYWERVTDGQPIGSSASVDEIPPSVGTWTYRVFGYNEGCPTIPEYIEFDIDVDEAPTVDAGGPYEVCASSAVQLNGTIGGSASSAEWIGGLGTFNPSRNTLNAFYTPHASEDGTTVNLLLRTNKPLGACPAAEAITTITVYEQPVANAGSDGNSCSYNFTLAANASVGTGTWTKSSGTGNAIFSNQNSPTSNVTVNAYDTYIFTWTEVNGICSDADNVTVNFYEQPVANAGPDDQTCGLTLTLGATASVGIGTWTLQSGPSAANFINENSPTSNVTVTAYGQYVLRWTEVNGTCSDFDEVVVDFFEQPVANAGTNGNSCSYSYTLDATASTGTGTWTKSSGTGNAIFSNLNSPTSGVTVDAYDTYVFTWTEVNGICSDADDVTVNFYEQPIANAGSDDQTCGLTLTLGATASVGLGTWTREAGPGAANFTNKNSPTSNVTVTAYGQYVFRWTEVNGSCSDFDELVVDFFEQPISVAGPDDETCGLSITLAAVPSAGVGTWTKISGSGTPTFGNVNDAGTSVTVSEYDQYVFRWTEVDGICSDFDEVTIDFYEQPVANAGSDNETCGFSISLAAIPSVGTGTWTLNLGPGAANFDDLNEPTTGVTVTAYGTYQFTWTEVNGTCLPSADNVTIDFFEQPLADAGTDDQTCGLSIALNANPSVGTGTWTRTSGPGTANFTNQNSPTSSVTVTAYGKYVLRWTEVNGNCSDFNEVTIDFFEQPVADAGTDGNSCSYNYTLDATASVGTGTWTKSSGTGNAIFSNPNSPTSGVTVDTYDTYVFTWTEVNGICSDADNVTVNFYEQPVANAGTDDITCGQTIALNATASVGTGTWTQFSGSGTSIFTNENSPTSNVTVNAYGQYVYRWTEVNGVCSDFDDVIIDFYEQPVADAGTGGGVCGTDFNLNAIPTVGTGTWTYTGPGTASFSPNANTHNATVTADTYGDYTLTWTEVNGICNSNDDILVSFYEQPVADAGSDAENCSLTATLSAVPSVGLGTWALFSGPAIATFVDANDPNTDVTVDLYGIYTFRWTEVNNICSDFADVTITFYETPTADAGADDNACGYLYTLNATPSVGTGVWTYTGPGTATLDDYTDPATNVSVDLLGLYTFTWTETNGICVDADDVNINFYEIAVDVAITDALCYGEANGTIKITATGGVEPYLYSIDGDIGPFQVDNEFLVPEGSYAIWVMDAIGCKAEYGGNSVYIAEPNEISVGFEEVLPVSGCFGNTNGVIDIKPYPLPLDLYEYTLTETPTESDWVDNNRFEGLAAGLYYPKVRHKETGCIAKYVGISLEIGQPQQIDFIIDNIVNVTGCWYNTNGRFRAKTPSGGFGIKQVSIDGVNWFSFPKTFMPLGIGTYTVYAKDENDCIVTKEVIITGPPSIEITTLDLSHNLCFNDANGIIDATATGGTGSLYYSLLLNGLPYTGPQATGLFENLVAGDYTLEILDDNNCILTEDITITSPDELIIETDITNISCSFAGNEGIISARATGGNEPYTITLYMGSVEQANFTNVNSGDWVEFTGLADANDYEVIVRDANPACAEVNSGMLTVIVPDILEFNPASLIVQNLECNGVPTGSITIAGQGGTLPYTYTLYDDASAQIGDPIDANDTNPVEFTDLPAGTYTVSIDDANNCGPVDSAPITITEPDAIEIDPLSISITNISCFGANDGEISLTATGGTGDLYYTITQDGNPVAGFITQTNNGTFAPLEPGVYIIEITDDNNCGPVLSEELTVIEPNAIEVNTEISDALCHGDNGSFTALATEGTPPYVYALEDMGNNIIDTQNGDVDEWVSFADIPAGDYTLYVDDANGCQTSTIITIAEPDEVTVSITTTESPTCDPDGTSIAGIIIATAQGGSGAYIYTIYRNGDYLSDNTDGIFNNLAAGDYSVEVYDTNGCGPATTSIETLVNPTTLEIDNVIVTDVNCYGQSTGGLEVIYSGELGTPVFNIIPGDDDWQTSNIFTDLPAGNYTVRVKDDNFCIVTPEV